MCQALCSVLGTKQCPLCLLSNRKGKHETSNCLNMPSLRKWGLKSGVWKDELETGGRLNWERSGESNTDRFHQGSDILLRPCCVLRPHNTVAKNTDLGIRRPCEKILAVNLQAMWSWGSYLTSLCHDFICKMRLKYLPSEDVLRVKPDPQYNKCV